jgi:two-component system, sporulation sensor kinase E
MLNFSRQYWLKIGLTSFALFIAFASLYYTNDLVNKLGEREKKLIDLYAKGLQSAAQAEDPGNLSFLFQEVIQANSSVPVILADAQGNPLSYRNVDIPTGSTPQEELDILHEEMQLMANTYPPVEMEYIPGLRNYVFYRNSKLLSQLKYYPYIQLIVFFIFILLGYMVINNSRNAEQNRVWVGMSKETAHQLGTPISSLMAWNELFRSDPNFSHPEAVEEIEKDIKRLETITSRFSNIGSIPSLKEEPVVESIIKSIEYLKQRVSDKVKFGFSDHFRIDNAIFSVNKDLIDWALENIIKNAVDAMSGIGEINISIIDLDKQKFALDISDTGKGMTKQQMSQVFNAGFTTKVRGWGLGLTLTKRIIEQYHDGKVFVKNSKPGKGTTFRIILDYKIKGNED